MTTTSTTTQSPVHPSHPDLRPLVDAYRTCELATISKTGIPVTWPAVAISVDDGRRLLLTTSIGLPQKAHNIRRDSRVALLFSDPTGSGRSDLPQVLVQGTASCPDEIHTSPEGMEGYWARLAVRQPSSRSYTSRVTRRLLDWYYMRLVITVDPGTVTTGEPWVESGQQLSPGLMRVDGSAYAETARAVAGYRSAVLGLVRGDAPPTLVRVRLRADGVTRRLVLEGPTTGSLTPGPASILMHSHDDQLADLRMFGAFGELVPDDDGWTFAPSRVLAAAGGGGPVQTVRAVRRIRGTADAYLARRQLARPAIAWGEFERVAGRDLGADDRG